MIIIDSEIVGLSELLVVWNSGGRFFAWIGFASGELGGLFPGG